MSRPTPPGRLIASLLATALLLPACGSDGTSTTANAGNNAEEVVDTGPSMLSIIAGTVGGPGNTDGTLAQARFVYPQAMAIDASGNMYVADQFMIRKITPEGVVSTLAGTGERGSADGTGRLAGFGGELYLAVDPAGNVYVADCDNQTLRKITPQGVVSTLAGQTGWRSTVDGTGASAAFQYPRGIVVAPDGNIYVHDWGTLRQVTPDGVVTTVVGSASSYGSVDGTGASVRLDYYSFAMTVDADGNIYMVEPGVVRKVTPAGEVSTIAGVSRNGAHVDGTGANARFVNAKGITVDADGNLYVTQEDHTIRKVTPAGVVTTLAGQIDSSGATNGSGTAASFSYPFGIVTDSTGQMYVGDSGSAQIRKVTPAGVVSTHAGMAGSWGTADGTGAAAQFNGAYYTAANASGLIYVADTYNHALRKVTADGVVTTYSGSKGDNAEGYADGPLAQALFSYPYSLQLDSSNKLWMLDQGGTAIRQVSPDGVVSTLVSPDSGSLGRACAMTLDSSGNAYVGDSQSDTILKVTSAGVVSTLAGNSNGGGISLGASTTVRAASVQGSSATRSGYADGTGADAQFNSPCGLATDAAGNVYVADTNNRVIRKVTPAGVVTTLAGTPGTQGSADGTGSAATFNNPSSLAISRSGNLYVADGTVIRKVTPAGVVSTVAGQVGLYGLQTGALPGVLSSEVALSITGNTLYLGTGSAVAKISPLP